MTVPPSRQLNKTLPVPTRERRLPSATGRSLRTRWRLYMLVGVNAVAIGVVIAALVIALLERRGGVLRLHETTARQTHAALQRALDQTASALIVAGESPAEDELARVLGAFPAIDSINVVGRDGSELVHVPASDTRPALDWTADPAWIALDAGTASVVWQIGDDQESGQITLATAPDQADPDAPYVIARLDAQALWADDLAVAVGDSGYVYLLDDSGAVLAAAQDRAAALDAETSARPAGFDIFTETRGGGAVQRLYEGLDGAWVIGRGEAFPAAGYTVVVETPLSDFTPSVVRVLALAALALVLTALVGEGLIRLILRTVMGPLERLQIGARAVAAGDYRYRVRVPPNTDRELFELGESFNRMAERLSASQRQLDAYTNEMQEIIDQRARVLARKASQLEVAAEISHTITSLLDQRALVEGIVERIKYQFDVYHVELLCIDEDTGRILPCSDRDSAIRPELTLRDVAHSVIAHAARHGKTVYVPDVTADPRYVRAENVPASQCELAIPLKLADTVLGVLNLEADHRNAFPPDEVAVLQNLATAVAISLRNARMFEALEIANQELMQASLQAKQANTLKSRFLFNASHKLRTPLNAIIGYSETILSGVYGEIPDTVLDRQRRILENGRVLNVLVEDMLDLSAIETGHLQLKLEWLPLTPLLEEVMNATRALVATAHPDHDLELRLDLSDVCDPLPPVWADLERLRYILINLTSNAVKFTEQGDVVLSADCDDRWVRIHVRDTGPGISDNDIRYLFQPFQHQQGSTGYEGKGTGLGLPVSRLLAMHHGGELTVESELHAGSTFTLNLPRRPEGAPPPPGEA